MATTVLLIKANKMSYNFHPSQGNSFKKTEFNCLIIPIWTGYILHNLPRFIINHCKPTKYSHHNFANISSKSQYFVVPK